MKVAGTKMYKKGDKHLSQMIRKKFHKGEIYRCCDAPCGNKNKFSIRYCCTYPQVHRRLNIKKVNWEVAREIDDDFQCE